MEFAVPADHNVKIKETDKLDNYVYFAPELKKLQNKEK